MRDLSYPGGWYSDALPDGKYLSNVMGSHVVTDYDTVPLPQAQNLLFGVRDPSPGSKRLAGIGNEDGLCWEWNGSTWVSQPGPVSGPYAVAYDNNGVLLVSRPGDGTQAPYAFRYIDEVTNKPVWGGSTMVDIPRQIFEFTTRGVGDDAITIGQAMIDGMVALYQGRRYKLASGNTQFIHFHRDGDNLSLAWWQDENHSCLRWLTVAELVTYPVEQPPAPPVPPVVPGPTVDLTVAPITGPVPLAVRASVVTTGVTTRRWVVDNVIVGYDGDEHAFLFSKPGAYVVEYRGAHVTANCVKCVTVTATERPMLTGRDGLQTGFGSLRGAPLMSQVRSYGWDMMRVSATDDPAVTRQIVDEVQAVNARPYVICFTAAQAEAVPEYTDVEASNENDIGGSGGVKRTSQEYLAFVLSLLEVTRRRHQTLWAGVWSNPSKEAHAWAKAVFDKLPPDVCVSFHRYPQNQWDAPSTPRSGFANREAESAWVESLNRPWGVSEGGWRTGTVPFLKAVVAFLKTGRWRRTMTQADQAANEKYERAWWKARGANFYAHYQVGEAMGGDGAGVFDYQDNPKLAARVTT